MSSAPRHFDRVKLGPGTSCRIPDGRRADNLYKLLDVPASESDAYLCGPGEERKRRARGVWSA
eukprot:756577-Hanusia_phi.AAC.2